jgi:hypothetical protein
MAKDILGGFGRDTSQPQVASATSGGVTFAKELPYSPPQGPKGIMDPKSPGLHGSNHGNTDGGSMSGGSHSVSPGIGAINHGCCGSQGKY